MVWIWTGNTPLIVEAHQRTNRDLQFSVRLSEMLLRVKLWLLLTAAVAAGHVTVSAAYERDRLGELV